MFGYSNMIPPQGVDRRGRTSEDVGRQIEIKVQLTVLIDFNLSNIETLIQSFIQLLKVSKSLWLGTILVP